MRLMWRALRWPRIRSSSWPLAIFVPLGIPPMTGPGEAWRSTYVGQPRGASRHSRSFPLARQCLRFSKQQPVDGQRAVDDLFSCLGGGNVPSRRENGKDSISFRQVGHRLFCFTNFSKHLLFYLLRAGLGTQWLLIPREATLPFTTSTTTMHTSRIPMSADVSRWLRLTRLHSAGTT